MLQLGEQLHKNFNYRLQKLKKDLQDYENVLAFSGIVLA